MSRSNRKKAYVVLGWFGIAISVALSSCNQLLVLGPAGNAVAKSEADPEATEDEEEGSPPEFEAFKTLLESGKSEKAIAVLEADPHWKSFRDDDDLTPLHYAAQVGDVEAVAWLLNNGADVNATAYNNFTPLHLAENPKVVALILQKKPDLTLQGLGTTALQDAAKNLVNPGRADEEDSWFEVIRLMLDAGAEYDIITAIHLDDLDRVKTIIEESPELASRFRLDSPLRTAATLGRLEICQYLIHERHVDVNDFEGGHGYPIIKGALAYPNVVRLLIESGADLKTRITWRECRSGIWLIGDAATALHYAAYDGVPETIDLLIDNGVDIFARSLRGVQETDYQTALEVASLFGKADNARAILKHPHFAEADAQIRQKLVDKCLLIGAHSPKGLFQRDYKWPQMVELLLENGANPNGNEDGMTVMMIVANEIHPNDLKQNREARDIVASLVRHGATLDIFSAVAIGDEAQVSRLLKENPEAASSRRPDGYPALHFAVGLNYRGIVEVLLKSGCNVDIRNKCNGTGYTDETALHNAAFWGRYDIAKLLIESGADVNALTDRRNTPLHEAAQCGSVRVLKLLLESGAKPDAVDKNGETPLDWCRQQNHTNAFEVESIIRAHGMEKDK